MKKILTLWTVLVILNGVKSSAAESTFDILSESRFTTAACDLDGNCFYGVAAINFNATSRYQAVVFEIDTSPAACLPVRGNRLKGTFMISERQTRLPLALVMEIDDGVNVPRTSWMGLGTNNWTITRPGWADLDRDLLDIPLPPSPHLKVRISFQGDEIDPPINFTYSPASPTIPGISMTYISGTERSILKGTPLLKLMVLPQQPSASDSVALTAKRVGDKVAIGYPRGLINYTMEAKGIGLPAEVPPGVPTDWFPLRVLSDVAAPGKFVVDPRNTQIPGIMFRLVRRVP